MPTKVPPNAKPKAKTEKRAGIDVFPSTRIDEDFVARALAGLPETEERNASIAAGPRLDERSTVNAQPRTTAPLPGMMSLGAGLGALTR
jgi:hypothetical protein